MPLTALQIVQAVVNELGLPQVNFITANNNTTVRQIVALMNRAGDELYQDKDWVISQALAVISIDTPVTTTGDTVAGSTTISNIPSTAGIEENTFAAVGNGLITSTRVVEILSATSVRVDQQATETQTGVDLIFARDTYEMPASFKWFLNRTMWDRTNQWELIGPMSPQADEWQRSGVVTTGPRRRWREQGVTTEAGGTRNMWRLWPPPTATGSYPATLIFEYEADTWARDVTGGALTSMTADDDYPIIDGQAIVLSTKWRLWQAKGFNYGALQAEYMDYVDRLKARDGGAADLSLAKAKSRLTLIGPDQVADGFWPGPGNP